VTDQPQGLVERCQARVGSTLRGKWTIDGLIDVGGMAAVYAATHRNGNRVAIKMLHPEALLVDGVKQRLLKEGYVANQVGHAGAVRVLDDDETDDGVAFLVMELLEGETLQTRMDRHGGRLTVEDVLCITDKVLDILRAAHARDIFHRDIKPANIFITLGAEVKLLDFGIARARQMQNKTSGIHAPTMAGTVLGTPGYIPPEQAYGRVDELDARSDLWAVGAMMFATLAGRCAHEATTINEQLILAATRPAPPLATALPGAPGPLCAVIDRALGYRKEDRWQSAAAMQKAVQDVFHEIEGFRLSRDNHMAAVAAEIPASRRPGEPPSAAATLIGHPVTQLTQPWTQHAVVTPAAPLPEHRPSPRRAALAPWTTVALLAAGGLCAVAIGLWTILGSSSPGDTASDEPAALPVTSFSPGAADSPTATPGAGVGAPAEVSPPPDPQGSSAPGDLPRPKPAEPPSAGGQPSSSAGGQPSSSAGGHAAAEAQGILNINSIPVSKVILDGRPLGETPKVGVRVAPGAHQVTFVHQSGRKSVSVTVAAGETKAAVVKFDTR
jgi:serine/threonine protein kinase